MTLLFDFGGVIVDLDRPRCIEAFARLGMDVAPYLSDYRQADVFARLERGEVDVPAFCGELRRLTGCSGVPDEAIVSAWEAFLPQVPAERLEMLLRLKRHYSVSLLSNTNPVHWRQATGRFFRYKGLQAEDFFDHIFLSYREGVEKPRPELYRTVIRRTGEKPENIVFFDDCEENCEAARRCGMRALLVPAGSAWFKYFDENGKLRLS